MTKGAAQRVGTVVPVRSTHPKHPSTALRTLSATTSAGCTGRRRSGPAPVATTSPPSSTQQGLASPSATPMTWGQHGPGRGPGPPQQATWASGQSTSLSLTDLGVSQNPHGGHSSTPDPIAGEGGTRSKNALRGFWASLLTTGLLGQVA